MKWRKHISFANPMTPEIHALTHPDTFELISFQNLVGALVMTKRYTALRLLFSSSNSSQSFFVA